MLACGCVSAMPGHVSCAHEPVCLLWMGALWDLLGQFLENQLPNSKTSAAAGLGISLLTARCDQPLPVPGALRDGLDACSKALGEATSHASGPAGHIGQRARAGVWDFWLFFKVLPATLSLRCTTLCSMSARGGGMI